MAHHLGTAAVASLDDGDLSVSVAELLLVADVAGGRVCSCPPDCAFCGGVGSAIDCARVACPLEGQ